VEFNNEDKTGVIVIPNTGGWQTYKTITKEITLTEGKQIMKVLMGDGAFNLNHFRVKEKEIVTGLSSIENESVNVYPNPVSEKLTIEFGPDFKKNTMMRLYDSSGVLVKKHKLVTQKTELPTHTITPGIYLLQIQVRDKIITRKIIIE